MHDTRTDDGRFPPGWYPSPSRPGCAQWWDGRAWADTFQLIPVPIPVISPVQRTSAGDVLLWIVGAPAVLLFGALVFSYVMARLERGY